MSHSICQSCRSIRRLRFQHQISHLQKTRRARSTGTKSRPLESWYWDTIPPNSRQLAAAKHFFDLHRPQKVWTANEWQVKDNSSADNETLVPEVAFLGRSNVGKSSLLNALLDSPLLNKVGDKPGKTKVVHAYGLSASNKNSSKKGPVEKANPLVTVLDAPGYGHGSQNDWGESIIKYLKQRKQLRRVFVLINAQHGVLQNDLNLLKLLRENTVSHEVIATKCDRLEPPSKRQEKLNLVFQDIRTFVQPKNSDKAFTGLGEILSVGWVGDGKLNYLVQKEHMQGISAVQWAVLRATGLDQYAYDKFNELPEARGYDDSPMSPNDVRVHADPKSLLTPSSTATRSGPETLASEYQLRALPRIQPALARLAGKPVRPLRPERSRIMDALSEIESSPEIPRGMDNLPPIKPSQRQPDPPQYKLSQLQPDPPQYKPSQRQPDPPQYKPSQSQPGVSHGMEGLLSALDQGKSKPSTQQRQTSRSRSPLSRRNHPTTTDSAPPPQKKPGPTTPSGPGVSHGMEGLLSALGSDGPRSAPSSPPKSRMARRRHEKGARKYQ